MKRKTITFYFLIILSFLFSVVIFSKTYVNKYFVSTLYNSNFNKMNIILDTKNQDGILINVNNKYYSFIKSKNIINKPINSVAEKINILIDKNYNLKDIKNIVIFNGYKTYSYNDFSKFQNKKENLCINKNCKEYTSYDLPKEIKNNYNSYNQNSLINKINAFILSFLSGSIIYFLPYIIISISILYYLKNKKKIKILKIKSCIIPLIIFLFAISFRANNLTSYLPWGDESYSIWISNPNNNITTIFKDPGNPCFFFLIFRLYLSIFPNTLFFEKLFPLLISILGLIILYIFTKKEFNSKIANLSLFFFSINIPLIYYSQEIRSYILQIFLVILNLILIKKITKKFKIKYYILYAILSIILCNTHYYMILFILSNLFLINGYFIFKKKYKEFIYFTFSSVLGLVSFLPYFIITSYNNAILDENFNSNLVKLNFNQILNCILYIFGGMYSFILSIIFSFNLLKNKIIKNDVIYIFSTIILVFFMAIIVSFIIRPIVYEKYFTFLIPLICILLGFIFSEKYNNKIIYILFFIWILSFSHNGFIKNPRQNYMLDWANFEIAKNYKNSKYKNDDFNIILRKSSTTYPLIEKSEKIKEKHFHFLTKEKLNKNENKIFENKVKEIQSSNKNSIIFTSLIETKNNKYNTNYTCYFNSTFDICVWKIEN